MQKIKKISKFNKDGKIGKTTTGSRWSKGK